MLISKDNSEQIKALGSQNHKLLLGITGGIASGKTTVTQMFLDLGSPLIDFDVLAREVVEPGRAAWKDIVACFGKDILQKDQTLERKRLSEIVFKDPEKRKKLEQVVHPRIMEIFEGKLKQLLNSSTSPVIQVDIPLMIERNLHCMFHKLLLVYVPMEKQVERLIERDGISKEKADQILDAQMSIDDKLSYADFVIHNDKTLENTRQQVEKVWQALKNTKSA